MAKNMKIRRGNDGFSYPYTSPDIVIDENGKSATTKFNELEAKIKAGSGTSIDDVSTSTDKTWSSSKIDSQFKDIAKKVDNIGQGGASGSTDADGITIKDTNNHFTATNVEGALDELFQFASNGKTLIADAVTGKGVATNPSDSFQTMATNIGKINGIDGAIVQIKGITYKLSVDSNGTVIATKTAGAEGLIEGRILLWNEDFEGTSIDTDTWTFDDRDKYSALVNSWTGGARTTVQDSILHIQAVKQKHGSYTADWSSDQLWTRKKYANSNCRWECKMKFDVMNGCWPAFWLMGDNFTGTGPEKGQGGLGWPACGELDIMEFMGGANGNLSSAIHYANIFSDTEHKSKSLGTWTDKVNGNLTDWHIYGCEITDSQVIIDVDGVVCKTANLSEFESDFGNAFKMPMYPLISLQIGQSGGTPDADATEMNVYVDWVRCYAPVGTTVSGDIESIQITGLTTEISTGVKQVANVTYTPVASKNKTVAWSSSNPNVATVKNGLIESIADGSTTITATSKNGITTSVDVTVSTVAEYPVTALAFDRTYKPIVKDCSYTPNLTITPSYATDNIVFSSSDNSKFTVNINTGQVTPVGVGTANLIATADSGITATLPIEIISESENAYVDALYTGTKLTSNTGIGGQSYVSGGFDNKIHAKYDDYTIAVKLTDIEGAVGTGFTDGSKAPNTSCRPSIVSQYNLNSNLNKFNIYGTDVLDTFDLITLGTPFSVKLAIVVKDSVLSYYKNGVLIKTESVINNKYFVNNPKFTIQIKASSGTSEIILYRRALTDADAKAITT